MNYYIMTIENSDDVLVDYKVFQSVMTMDELRQDDWWEIAAALKLAVDKEEGDTIDIDPIIDPPII